MMLHSCGESIANLSQNCLLETSYSPRFWYRSEILSPHLAGILRAEQTALCAKPVIFYRSMELKKGGRSWITCHLVLMLSVPLPTACCGSCGATRWLATFCWPMALAGWDGYVLWFLTLPGVVGTLRVPSLQFVLALLVLLVLPLCQRALAEEPGWRGFAMP